MIGAVAEQVAQSHEARGLLKFSKECLLPFLKIISSECIVISLFLFYHCDLRLLTLLVRVKKNFHLYSTVFRMDDFVMMFSFH